jgi:hypothetical protein
MFHLLKDRYQLVQNNKLVQEYEAKEFVFHHQVLHYYRISVYK